MYEVSPDKLQELNELINEGGQIPTEVNQATGKTAELLGQGNIPGAKASNAKASTANDKSGAAWSEIQAWHDSVKDSGGGNGGGEPGTGPGNSTTPTGDVNVQLTWGVYQDRNPSGDPFVMSSIIGTLVVPTDPAEIAKVTNSRFSAAEFEGTPAGKHLTVSTSPKNYGPKDGVNVIAEAWGLTPTIGVPTSAFEPGTTYYVNVRNEESPTSGPTPGNYPALMGYAPTLA